MAEIPFRTQARLSTKYSVIEQLEHGRCWKLRRLDGRDEDGVTVGDILLYST